MRSLAVEVVVSWWLVAWSPSLLSPSVPLAAQAGPDQCHSPGTEDRVWRNSILGKAGDVAGTVSGPDLRG